MKVLEHSVVAMDTVTIGVVWDAMRDVPRAGVCVVELRT